LTSSEGFRPICERENFVLNSLIYLEPVERFQKRSNVMQFRSFDVPLNNQPTNPPPLPLNPHYPPFSPPYTITPTPLVCKITGQNTHRDTRECSVTSLVYFRPTGVLFIKLSDLLRALVTGVVHPISACRPAHACCPTDRLSLTYPLDAFDNTASSEK